jgi:hypothetical protein
MIDWFCHHRLLEDVISSRLKVDVLPISRLFLIQRPLKKEQDRLTKVLIRVAILITRDWPCCIDGLQEVLVEHLLPRRPVLSLAHVLELRKGVNPGEFTFFCPLIELGDCLVNSELDRVTSMILVDFNGVFVFGIVATQLVDFQQGVVVIPFLFALVERGTLIDGCHRVVLVPSRVLLSFYGALHVLPDAARSICLNLSRSTKYFYNYSALPHGSGYAQIEDKLIELDNYGV